MKVSATSPSLRLELIAMAKADQEMRNNAIKHGGTWDSSIDKKHTENLKKIIAKYGWPTIPVVGVEASIDAWLIAQHADHDRAFQKKCLKILKALPKGEISPHNIAYLEDRILVAEGKPQLYGTQFRGSKEKLEPEPIKDARNVDKRRKTMGLNTMAEYAKSLRTLYS